jgi:hypothetical protein
MPRAELPAIIPLRQFGEDTWLAPASSSRSATWARHSRSTAKP